MSAADAPATSLDDELFAACSARPADVDAVRRLVASGANPSVACTPEHWSARRTTAMHEAVCGAGVDVVRALLASDRLDFAVLDGAGRTPLMRLADLAPCPLDTLRLLLDDRRCRRTLEQEVHVTWNGEVRRLPTALGLALKEALHRPADANAAVACAVLLDAGAKLPALEYDACDPVFHPLHRLGYLPPPDDPYCLTPRATPPPPPARQPSPLGWSDLMTAVRARDDEALARALYRPGASAAFSATDRAAALLEALRRLLEDPRSGALRLPSRVLLQQGAEASCVAHLMRACAIAAGDVRWWIDVERPSFERCHLELLADLHIASLAAAAAADGDRLVQLAPSVVELRGAAIEKLRSGWCSAAADEVLAESCACGASDLALALLERGTPCGARELYFAVRFAPRESFLQQLLAARPSLSQLAQSPVDPDDRRTPLDWALERAASSRSDDWFAMRLIAGTQVDVLRRGPNGKTLLERSMEHPALVDVARALVARADLKAQLADPAARAALYRAAVLLVESVALTYAYPGPALELLESLTRAAPPVPTFAYEAGNSLLHLAAHCPGEAGARCVLILLRTRDFGVYDILHAQNDEGKTVWDLASVHNPDSATLMRAVARDRADEIDRFRKRKECEDNEALSEARRQRLSRFGAAIRNHDYDAAGAEVRDAPDASWMNDYKFADERTALTRAVACGALLGLVRAMLEAGARLDAQRGAFRVAAARRADAADAWKVLEEAGPKPDEQELLEACLVAVTRSDAAVLRLALPQLEPALRSHVLAEAVALIAAAPELLSCASAPAELSQALTAAVAQGRGAALEALLSAGATPRAEHYAAAFRGGSLTAALLPLLRREAPDDGAAPASQPAPAEALRILDAELAALRAPPPLPAPRGELPDSFALDLAVAWFESHFVAQAVRSRSDGITHKGLLSELNAAVLQPIRCRTWTSASPTYAEFKARLGQPTADRVWYYERRGDGARKWREALDSASRRLPILDDGAPQAAPGPENPLEALLSAGDVAAIEAAPLESLDDWSRDILARSRTHTAALLAAECLPPAAAVAFAARLGLVHVPEAPTSRTALVSAALWLLSDRDRALAFACFGAAWLCARHARAAPEGSAPRLSLAEAVAELRAAGIFPVIGPLGPIALKLALGPLSGDGLLVLERRPRSEAATFAVLARRAIGELLSRTPVNSATE